MHPENIASQRVLEKAGLTFINEADYFGMHVCRYVTTADRHGAYTLSTEPGTCTLHSSRIFLPTHRTGRRTGRWPSRRRRLQTRCPSASIATRSRWAWRVW